jgi:predicted transposase YbfD/YdcC
VVARLDPEQFQTGVLRWLTAVSARLGGQGIAIDGKVLRRSHDRGVGQAALDMVSAWATANRLVLGQVKVTEKSNELTALPRLLEALEISGCIVTIDAMGCQTDIAQAIVEHAADYVLALKENQGQLYEDVQLLFNDLESSQYRADAFDYIAFDEDCCRVRKDHGPENLALLRHLALNLLKHEKTCHRSIKGKRLLAGWKNDYLLKVLAGLAHLGN